MYFEAFCGNWLKISLFVQKLYLKQKLRMHRNLFFLYKFVNGKSWGKFTLMKELFSQTSEMEKVLTKMVFLFKISHIHLNQAFLIFWSIFAEIDWKPFFGLKSDYLRKKLWNTQFSATLKWGKSYWKFWFDRNNFFLSNQWNGTNITKNCFPPKNEPLTVKLSFSGVMKHFRGNWLKTSLWVKKCDYLIKTLRITQRVIFLNNFEKGQIIRDILIW